MYKIKNEIISLPVNLTRFNKTMKKVILSIVIVMTALSCLTFTTSCQKEYNANTLDDTAVVRNPMQGTFTCIVGGAPFTGNMKYYSDTSIEDVRVLSVSAQQFSPNMSPYVYQTMAFSISFYEAPGTYKADGIYVTGAYTSVDTYSVNNYAIVNVDTVSNITITENGSNIAGTFFFTIRPAGATSDSMDIQVQSGEFNIPKN